MSSLFWYCDPEEGPRTIKTQHAGGMLHPPVRTLADSFISAAGRNANESLPAYQKTAHFLGNRAVFVKFFCGFSSTLA